MQTSTERCAYPLGAEVDLVPTIVIGRMHDGRLQHTAVLVVRGKFIERVLGKSVRGLFASSYSVEMGTIIGVPSWPRSVADASEIAPKRGFGLTTY